MKLWKKIALLCSVILIAAVAACSLILLGQVQQKILSYTYEHAADKQRILAYSFEEMAERYLSEADSDVVKYVLLEYCFSRYADSSSVLMAGDKIIYSQAGINPNEYLALDGQGMQQQFLGKINGRYILITGSSLLLSTSSHDTHSVYVVEDITPIYESTIRMFWQFALIGAVCIGVGVALIALLVRRSLQPLAKLQAAASRIAAGNYSERADVRGGNRGRESQAPCSGNKESVSERLRSKDEVGLLAADFNRMAEAVEQRIRELTETARRQQMFIGGVTHEFKTPLTGLILSADTLQNTYMDEEERMVSLGHIERQCRWLERLVQKMWKLLTLNGKAELKKVSVPSLLESVRESVEEDLRSRGIVLEIQCKADTAVLDPDLMQSVLVNLVENAAKASTDGQTVTLAAYENVLEVRDHGIGIRQEDLEHITEPFYTADKSRSKKYGGAGLGLALVKEIVKAHNAGLDIESVYGEGTVVRVYLEGRT